MYKDQDQDGGIERKGETQGDRSRHFTLTINLVHKRPQKLFRLPNHVNFPNLISSRVLFVITYNW